MLIKYTFDNKVFKLTRENERVDDQNVFTILVGKNGTGKSRLLSGIVNETLGGKPNVRTFDNRTISQYSGEISMRLNYDLRPEKIIATSTSPFDKFPLPKRNVRHPFYSYLGLRDLPSQDFGLAYLSKIMLELISSVASYPEQMQEIGQVLGYLGYTDKILLRIENRIGQSFLNRFMSEKDAIIGFKNAMENNSFIMVPTINKRFFLNDDGDISVSKVMKLRELIANNTVNFKTRRSDILLNNQGINFVKGEYYKLSDFLFLFEAGLLKLRGVDLEESTGGEIFSISDASSGEQCVVLSILGIASQIKNNSLICIDEPEICLHPEWQERYIRILISTFRNYRNCHFIIATHSPQIISNLASTNCYILSVESRKIINADTVNENSIDFQLANVFKAPGFKNEYLSRIALHTFVKVSKYKRFDSHDLENLELLLSVNPYFKINDPIIQVVSSLIKLKEIYA